MMILVVFRTKCDSGQQQMLLQTPVQLSQVSADAGETTLNVFMLFIILHFKLSVMISDATILCVELIITPVWVKHNLLNITSFY